MQGKGQRRVVITEAWEEDSMHGLVWCVAADAPPHYPCAAGVRQVRRELT